MSYKHYGTKNFQFLVTVATQQRLNNLAETTQKAGVGHFYWFIWQGNVDVLPPNLILGDIWTVVGWAGMYTLKTLKLRARDTS